MALHIRYTQASHSAAALANARTPTAATPRTSVRSATAMATMRSIVFWNVLMIS